MSILAILGALLIGLSLGLLGSGGSILTVPALIYLAGQDEKVAIAGSLFVVGAVSLVGSSTYARRGQVHWSSVLWFGVPGMAGTWGGAWLSRWVSADAQLLLFALVMLAAAVLMARAPAQQVARPGHARSRWLVASEGLAVGLLTGLVGVGGGFLILPALVLLGGLSMQLAVGTSLVIIALKSFTGFVKYIDVLASLDRELDWTVLGWFTALGIAGSLAGGALGGRLPQQALRRSFAALLVVVGLGLIVERLT